MLPAVRTAVITATTAAAIALAPAAPALAWGKKEQGFVAGVATFWLLNEIAKDNRRRHVAPQPGPAPQPIYVPAPVHASPAKAAFLEYSANGRRAIQSRLKSYGYYHGSVDGVWGSGTARAVADYARDVGYGDAIGTRNGAIQLYNSLIG